MQLDWVVIAGLGTVFTALLGWLIYRRWFRRTELQNLVRDISQDSLVNVFLPDGLGGEIHIDHLLLTPRGVLLLDTKDVAGTLFAGERLDEWSANSNAGRVTFENPLPRLEDRVSAIRQLAPGTPIDAKVVFTDTVSFPKGRPEAVTTIAELGEHYSSELLDTEIYETAWQTITSSARPI